jgi:hypothetical protein
MSRIPRWLLANWPASSGGSPGDAWTVGMPHAPSWLCHPELPVAARQHRLVRVSLVPYLSPGPADEGGRIVVQADKPGSSSGDDVTAALPSTEPSPPALPSPQPAAPGFASRDGIVQLCLWAILVCATGLFVIRLMRVIGAGRRSSS